MSPRGSWTVTRPTSRSARARCGGSSPGSATARWRPCSRPCSTRIHWKREFRLEAPMKLTAEQLAQFDRDGYLFFPSLFTPAEIKALTDEVPRLYAMRRPENVREKGSEAVRTNFAAHMYSRPFAKLARHPRMVDPVMQIFGEQVYMHQFKVNGKMAFDGDVWQWHQDYGTWMNDDLMP